MSYLGRNDDEQVTISDLAQKMREFCGDECYTPIHFKQKFLEHFQNDVTITEVNGLANVVTFTSTASSILRKFYEEPMHRYSERNNYA